jgi:hypothetical protein
VLARQAGRTLRRAHQVAAPGYGRPALNGRWPAASWPAALGGWLARRETLACAEEALGLECTVALIDATIDHPALACARPCVIHSAVEPARMIVTVSETMQLEALTRPGELVGGDPIFDLAHGLLPRHPATFRQGLIEGYSASGPLDAEQQERLRRLGLLLLAADTLQNGDAAALARLPDDIAAGLRALG